MDDRQTPAPILWPTAWLMIDDRLGKQLWAILTRMSAGSGVVLRDSSIAGEVARMCAARGLVLAVASDVALAEQLGAALVHNPVGPTALPVSRSVHDEAEARRAEVEGAALIFISPVYPTRSHPGAPSLGIDGARRLADLAGIPAIALGGMDSVKFDALRQRGFHGWAGIDAWLSPAPR